MASADDHFAEVTVDDFEGIRTFWDTALPEERAVLLGRMAEKLYIDFETGQPSVSSKLRPPGPRLKVRRWHVGRDELVERAQDEVANLALAHAHGVI